MPRIMIALVVAIAACSPGFSLGVFERPVKLSGTVFEHPSPAPDFTLTDQHGSPFHMADTRGKVVVMTFIYTHCTDLCPFVALKLKAARDLLGSQSSRAAFVAVTTDPARDTTAVLASYSKAAGLYDGWSFVTGPLASVKEVWFNYGVGVDILKQAADKQAPAPKGEAVATSAEDEEPSQGLSQKDLGQARGIADRFGGGYEVSHTTPIWIIDPSGRIRATMDADCLPSEIAGNVRALMNR